jgi:3-oxoacyl-[acyl-carrier-protein] synthase II
LEHRVNRRRIVVTGIGVVSPIGSDVSVFWEALVSGRSGVGPIRKADGSAFRTSVAAEVKDFDPRDHVDGRTARNIDPSAVLVLAAARAALTDAELDVRQADVGVVVGLDAAYGSVSRAALALERQGPIGVESFGLVQMAPATAGALVARTLGLRAAHFAVSGACASGAVAILQAWNLIQLGYASAAIAACGSILEPLLLAACENARVLSPNPDPATASRPFDLNRDGFVAGEGAAALVLEERREAATRGAQLYAEVLGGWQNASNEGFTVNDPVSSARCIREALRFAGVERSEVDLVSAHATSTKLGDRQEAEALASVFGGRRVPAFAAKSSLGHCLSAAGGLESVAAVLAIRDGVAPPTLNYEHPDPACKVDCVPNLARRMAVQTVLKNSFGFGGVNCCLVFRECHG